MPKMTIKQMKTQYTPVTNTIDEEKNSELFSKYDK
jgi:hypothetical protein